MIHTWHALSGPIISYDSQYLNCSQLHAIIQLHEFNYALLIQAEADIQGFQIGKAVVGSGANKDSKCKPFVGKAATGRYDSCNHDGCTRAKNSGRNNLRNSRGLRNLPQCHKYIESNTPCQKFHC